MSLVRTVLILLLLLVYSCEDKQSSKEKSPTSTVKKDSIIEEKIPVAEIKKDTIEFIMRVNLHVISHSGKFIKTE